MPCSNPNTQETAWWILQSMCKNTPTITHCTLTDVLYLLWVSEKPFTRMRLWVGSGTCRMLSGAVSGEGGPKARGGCSFKDIKRSPGSSLHGTAEANLTEPWGCSFDPWPHSVGWGSNVAMSCGVGRRHGSDLAWLWLWHRLASLIRPLAWEPPYAVGAALKKKETPPPCKKYWLTVR